MTYIFYFIGFCFVIYELSWLLNPKDRTLATIKFKRLIKENKKLNWDNYPAEFKKEIKAKIPAMVYFLWLLVGLLTFQWAAFLLFFVFEIVVISPFTRLVKNGAILVCVHWVNSLVGLSFGLFILINKFHLHIDVWNKILTHVQ